MSTEGRPIGRPSMAVPDRIIYKGQDRHYGLNASPRELHLEPHGHHDLTIKMNTPPRTITLANSMTSLNRTDSNGSLQPSTEDEDDMTILSDPNFDHLTSPVKGRMSLVVENSQVAHPSRQVTEYRATGSVVQDYDEDIQDLRQQLNRVTRRMLILEEEMADRKRERYYFFFAALFGYAAAQAITWIRNGGHHY